MNAIDESYGRTFLFLYFALLDYWVYESSQVLNYCC